MDFGWYYPPGTAGSKTQMVTIRCTNDDCGHEWNATMTTELGSASFDDDDDIMCPECNCEGAIQY